MQNMDSSVYVKENKVVSYVKSFLNLNSQKNVKFDGRSIKNPVKFSSENKTQLFTEIKNLLDDL